MEFNYRTYVILRITIRDRKIYFVHDPINGRPANNPIAFVVDADCSRARAETPSLRLVGFLIVGADKRDYCSDEENDGESNKDSPRRP